MKDITLCKNKECPLNKVCKRFVSKTEIFYQSYSFFQPFLNNEKKIDCDYFLEDNI